MNYREDLFLKMQKVKLLIAEVNEHRFENIKEKRLTLEALSKIKNSILIKSKELQIEL